MTHPFTQIFMRALNRSTVHENLVLKEAKKLLEKGYSHTEVCGVLKQLSHALVDGTESGIVEEAYEECCESIE